MVIQIVGALGNALAQKTGTTDANGIFGVDFGYVPFFFLDGFLGSHAHIEASAASGTIVGSVDGGYDNTGDVTLTVPMTVQPLHPLTTWLQDLENKGLMYLIGALIIGVIAAVVIAVIKSIIPFGTIKAGFKRIKRVGKAVSDLV